ncbi:hypothetical protein [Streptomyces griseorubiginosus]|uniref:hypothetical protein n=1 Tax=Streptomyces griseorubiginosus TaxID=67304 RepID=UPI003F75AE88
MGLGRERADDQGAASRVSGAALRPYPFPEEHAPAYRGTALAFHFSTVPSPRCSPSGCCRAVSGASGPSAASRGARSPAPCAAPPEPGTSLPLLDEPGPGPHRAAGTPVGPAYAALRTASRSGAGLLDAHHRALRHTTLRDWDGAHPSAVLRGFPSRHERPGARLALPAAFAPYRITDEDVAAWRRPEHTDH